MEKVVGGRAASGWAVPEQLRSWRDRMATVSLADLDDDQRLELLRGVEDLSRTLAAVSAGVQVAFQASQVQEQASRGVPASRRGRAVADDLATARKTSPYWASRELTSARTLVHEMPRTWTALRDTTISALQARLISEATTCLSPEDRAEVDRRLAERLEGMSTRQMVAAARALTYEVDPAGFVARARKAAKDRGVSTRPAPDVMAVLSARLPAPQAIACELALRKRAEELRAQGDPRTVMQLMADELYERLTGRKVVDGIDVELCVVITDAALFDGDPAAADVVGFGPVPADVARDLLRPTDGDEGAGDEGAGDEAHEADDRAEPCPAGGRCTDASCTLLHTGSVPMPAPPTMPSREDEQRTEEDEPEDDKPTAAAPDTSSAATVWLRRLYADPVTGVLTVRDPRRRLFTGNLRATLVARGRYCANQWCGAPIRHVDHVRRRADGGETTEDNGRGLCARCNLAREHPRHSDPPPEAYLEPPPILDTFLGRPPRGAPRPAELRRPA